MRVLPLTTRRSCAAADPFLDANQGDDSGLQDGLIHIRIQQRSGRKTLTTVQGIADSYDKKKIVKACKKVSRGLPVSPPA